MEQSRSIESTLLPQYGFGATYTFDALVEHHHFLYRVHTPKRRRVLSRPGSPSPRSSSPLPSSRRPELSRSPSLSASFASIRSSDSGPTDYFAFSPNHPGEEDDAAPGDPYFLSRKFKDDLTSPDPGQRRRTISTLSSLSAGSSSFTYVGSDDGSDLESERSFGRRGTLSRSTSMMLGHSRVRSDSLSSSRPDARRSHSADVSESTTAADTPDVTQSTVMTYSDLVRHLDWTTRSSSPYVTTSFSFFWCLWEAVRRYKLAVKHDVEIAVIDARKFRGHARTALEVLRSVEPDKQDKAYWKWYRFALESQDVLVFGAISGDAIYASIPLSQILPKLPSYCYVDDIPKQVTDPREPDPTIDPRSPTTQTQNPFLTSTPNKTRSPNGERDREQERTALTTSYLLTKLAWDIGTTQKRPRKSKDTPSLTPGKPAPRHTSHAEFCKALSASFAKRSEADQLRDATTGAVGLAELLIEPWFRARCAELVTYPFRHDDDSDDEKEGSADKMHESVCLGLAGDGCTLEHSHDSSIQDALFGADRDDETEEEAARREAAAVLSELALSLARWPGSLWYTEHADTVEALVNDVVSMCVTEAARGLQSRIAWDIALEEERQRTRTVSLSGSVRSRTDSMSLSGSLHGSVTSERRGREEIRDRSRSRSRSPFSSPSKHVRIASENSPSRPSLVHDPPYKPRARSPLGASPVLGPAIVIRPKSRPESSQEQGTQQLWSPSTPPPSPPLNHSRSEGDLRDTSPTRRRSPPPPPPPRSPARSPARSQSASAVSFESTLPSPNSSPSVSRTSSSLLKQSLHRRAESIPGGWPNGDSSPEDRPGSPSNGQAADKKEEGDVFWDPSLQYQSKQRPLSWAGSGFALGGLASSASSSSESLRATIQASPSPSPSNSIRRGSSRPQSDDQGREALLTEVVSSALGLGTGAVAGASGSPLRLDRGSSLSSSEASSGTGTERPHVSARHRRHSSHGISLEMELSPVREAEQEDEVDAEAESHQNGMKQDAESLDGRDTVEAEAADIEPSRIDVSEGTVLTQTVLNDSPVEAINELETSGSKVQETSDERQPIPRQSNGTSTPRSERRRSRSSTLGSIPEEDWAEWSLVEAPPESEYQATVGRDEVLSESIMKEAEIPLPPSPKVGASKLEEGKEDDAVSEGEAVQKIPEITLSVDESVDAGREGDSRVVAEENTDASHFSPASATTEGSDAESTKALPNSKMFIFPFNFTLREPLARSKAFLSSFFLFPVSRLFSSLRTMSTLFPLSPSTPTPSPIFEDSELPSYSRRSRFFSFFRVPFIHPGSGFFGRWHQEPQPLSTLSILTPPLTWDAPILDDEPHASAESSVGYWDSRSTSWALSCFACGVAAALVLAAVQEHRCEEHMWIGNRYY